MKYILRNILLLFSLSIVFVNCDEDEVTRRDYPRLNTLPVSEITSEGAKFKAEIIFRGGFEVINYGFVWGENENPTKENSDRVIYSENIQSNEFSEIIETTLKEGVSYYVRAFVETNDFTVYGQNVNFLSLGSKAPEILSLSPLSGTWGDTLKIAGKNFSFIKDANIVKLGELKAEVISSTDSILSVIVPTKKNSNVVPLSVSIVGNTSSFEDEFTYLTPYVNEITPTRGTFGDTITISGQNFGRNKIWNQILIDNIIAEIVDASANKIKFLVPFELTKRLNSIDFISVGQQLVVSQNITLDPPEILSVQPKIVTRPNQEMTIYGNNFNPKESNNVILINGYTSKILQASNDSIKVELPNELIPFYNVSVFDTVSIQATVAEQTSLFQNKLVINWHSTWTKKKDFPGKARHNAVAFSIGNNGYFGTGLTGGSVSDELLKDFWKYDPSNDQWIKINDLPGISRAGATAFTIDNLGYVGLGSEDFYWNNPENDANHLKDFYSYDPDLDEWLKIADFPGIGRHSAASFSTNSKGYVVTGWWGKDAPLGQSKITNEAWEYDQELNLWNEVQSFPEASNHAVGFNVGNSAFIYDYNTLFEFKDQSWIKLSAPDLGAWDNIAFGINGLAYFGLGLPHQVGGTGLLYEYDPVSLESSKRPLSYSNKRWGASVFVIDNKAYIIGGATYNNGTIVLKDVWEFDPTKPEL